MVVVAAAITTAVAVTAAVLQEAATATAAVVVHRTRVRKALTNRRSIRCASLLLPLNQEARQVFQGLSAMTEGIEPVAACNHQGIRPAQRFFNSKKRWIGSFL